MKKEKSNFLVYLAMILLLTFIVVPPLFRVLIPKQSVPTNETAIDDIVLLNCNKTDSDGILSVMTSTRYRNGVFENNTIKFTRNDTPIDDNITDENINESTEQVQENITTTVASEYDSFMALTFLNPVVAENTTTITLTTELASQDETNFLNSYLQDVDNQKLYYESIGYTCSILRS